MMRLRFLLVIAGLSVATAAHAQLISERVEGAARLCRYAPTGMAAPRQALTGIDTDLELRRREEIERRRAVHDSGEREIEIDASRSCPSTFPDYQERRTIVPTYATLESHSRINGALFCTYRYLGQRYIISLRERSICPYTPVGLSY